MHSSRLRTIISLNNCSIIINLHTYFKFHYHTVKSISCYESKSFWLFLSHQQIDNCRTCLTIPVFWSKILWHQVPTLQYPREDFESISPLVELIRNSCDYNLWFFQTGNHVRLKDIDVELGEVCTAINKYAMSQNNSNAELEKQELKVLPGQSNELETAIPISIEGQPNSAKIENDENAHVGYITQLDKDGNIQQVPIDFAGSCRKLEWY